MSLRSKSDADISRLHKAGYHDSRSRTVRSVCPLCRNEACADCGATSEPVRPYIKWQNEDSWRATTDGDVICAGCARARKENELNDAVAYIEREVARSSHSHTDRLAAHAKRSAPRSSTFARFR